MKYRVIKPLYDPLDNKLKIEGDIIDIDESREHLYRQRIEKAKPKSKKVQL